MDELFAEDGYMDRLRSREMTRYFVMERAVSNLRRLPAEHRKIYFDAYEAGYRQGRIDGCSDARIAVGQAVRWLDEHE